MIITAEDVMLPLALQRFGTIETVVLLLVATIGACYFIEIFILARTTPNLLERGQALLRLGFRLSGMIYVAIGIIGATVMPHYLF